MISIVVLNWNSGAYLEETLESIAAQESKDWELIVVDNGSTNASLAIIDDYTRRGVVHQLVQLGANIGFADGMNRGIDRARGDVIVALNSDACVAPTFVGALSLAAREAREGHERIGTFAIPIFDWEYSVEASRRTERLQVLGVSLVRRMTVCTWHPDVDAASELIGPSGAVVIMTREAVDAARALAGFVYDPGYFAYAEDMDLFVRLYALGFRVKVVQSTRAWHIGSASSAQQVPLNRKPMRLQQMAHANKWRTWKKLGGLLTRLGVLPWIVLDDLLRVVIGPDRLRLLSAYLHNYGALLHWQARRYPAVRYPFAGALYSRSTPHRWTR